jgi:hypothetical protein
MGLFFSIEYVIMQLRFLGHKAMVRFLIPYTEAKQV